MSILARRAGLAIVLCVAGGLPGCGEDARLVEHDIPHVVVESVSDQGLELGPQASPKEVAYVVLRAIRDDVLAGHDSQARRAALLRQLAVCDPDYIYDFYKQVMGRRAVYDRDEWVYKKVNLWAPTVAYYVDSFDLDRETAESRMATGPTSRSLGWPGETVQVHFAASDPQGQPGAGAVVRILLHKHETGGWRVFHVGFAKRRPGPGAPQPMSSPFDAGLEDPAPSPLPESAR